MKYNLMVKAIILYLFLFATNAAAEKLRTSPFVLQADADIEEVNFDANILRESNISRAVITNSRVFAQNMMTSRWEIYPLEEFNRRFEVIETHSTLSVTKRSDGVGAYERRRDGSILSAHPIFIITGNTSVDAVSNNGNLDYLERIDNCDASAETSVQPLYIQIRCDRERYQVFNQHNWSQEYDYVTIDRVELNPGNSVYSPVSAICGRVTYNDDGKIGSVDQNCTYLNEYSTTRNSNIAFQSSGRYSILPRRRGDIEIHTKMLYPRGGLDNNNNYIGITCSQVSTEQRSPYFNRNTVRISPLGNILGFKQYSANRRSLYEMPPTCSISYKAGIAANGIRTDSGFNINSPEVNNALFDDLRFVDGNLKMFGQRDVDADKLSNIIITFGRYPGVYIFDEVFNFRLLINDTLMRNEVITKYSTQIYEKR